MKTTSRSLYRAALMAGILLAGVAWSDDTSSLQDIYDAHQSEILTGLSGGKSTLKAYDSVFVSGSARIIDDEDEEDAISMATLDAESSVIDAFYEEVDWPSKLPAGLRRELWNYYCSRTNTFALAGATTVEVVRGEDDVAVVVGVRNSGIRYEPPSYSDLIQAITE